MRIVLGVKTDPIQYRYSYTWLFDLLQGLNIKCVQLGGFFEMPVLDDGYFDSLRADAQRHGIRIRSVFTAHRELGGFMSGDRHLEKAARALYERYIQIGSLLKADYVGSGAGSVYRDRIDKKGEAVACYVRHMKELMHAARENGLKGLSMEVMSCSAEPPCNPDEMKALMEELGEYHQRNTASTVPVYLLADVSHGLADQDRKVVVGNMELFEKAIPYMCEFHLKNTDAVFETTFGFSHAERKRGIVNVPKIQQLLLENANVLKPEVVVGYLELPGPKIGRDYSDCLLEGMLTESIAYLKRYFPDVE